MTGLPKLIKAQIRKNGAISFCDYMEMCLYDPQLGYYCTQSVKIGKEGDFYTSAYLGNVFGALIAKKMEELWCSMGEKPFTIVEYGAGTGKLAEDILLALQNNTEMYQNLRYCIIERSPVMVDMEKERLNENKAFENRLLEKVTWHKDIAEIEDIRGCIFSNELLDNFSVHRVMMKEQLMEIFVDKDFKEVLKPASPALTDYLSALNVVLPPGFQTEINLQAISWIKAIAEALTQGCVMTIDYGDVSKEMYRTSRADGTLCCFRNHMVNADYYANIGEQDLTTHVNFSALSYWGRKYGLIDAAFTSQGEFLLQMGFNEFLMKTFSGEKDIALAARKIAMLRHALIMDMGCKFKILIQEKGMENGRA